MMNLSDTVLVRTAVQVAAGTKGFKIIGELQASNHYEFCFKNEKLCSKNDDFCI